MLTYPWKTIKKRMVDSLNSGRKLSLLSPILADGGSHTSISVVKFAVGCPSLYVYELEQENIIF